MKNKLLILSYLFLIVLLLLLNCNPPDSSNVKDCNLILGGFPSEFSKYNVEVVFFNEDNKSSKLNLQTIENTGIIKKNISIPNWTETIIVYLNNPNNQKPDFFWLFTKTTDNLYSTYYWIDYLSFTQNNEIIFGISASLAIPVNDFFFGTLDFTLAPYFLFKYNNYNKEKSIMQLSVLSGAISYTNRDDLVGLYTSYGTVINDSDNMVIKNFYSFDKEIYCVYRQRNFDVIPPTALLYLGDIFRSTQLINNSNEISINLVNCPFSFITLQNLSTSCLNVSITANQTNTISFYHSTNKNDIGPDFLKYDTYKLNEPIQYTTSLGIDSDYLLFGLPDLATPGIVNIKTEEIMQIINMKNINEIKELAYDNEDPSIIYILDIKQPSHLYIIDVFNPGIIDDIVLPFGSAFAIKTYKNKMFILYNNSDHKVAVMNIANKTFSYLTLPDEYNPNSLYRFSFIDQEDQRLYISMNGNFFIINAETKECLNYISYLRGMENLHYDSINNKLFACEYHDDGPYTWYRYSTLNDQITLEESISNKFNIINAGFGKVINRHFEVFDSANLASAVVSLESSLLKEDNYRGSFFTPDGKILFIFRNYILEYDKDTFELVKQASIEDLYWSNSMNIITNSDASKILFYASYSYVVNVCIMNNIYNNYRNNLSINNTGLKNILICYMYNNNFYSKKTMMSILLKEEVSNFID